MVSDGPEVLPWLCTRGTCGGGQADVAEVSNHKGERTQWLPRYRPGKEWARSWEIQAVTLQVAWGQGKGVGLLGEDNEVLSLEFLGMIIPDFKNKLKWSLRAALLDFQRGTPRWQLLGKGRRRRKRRDRAVWVNPSQMLATWYTDSQVAGRRSH